ncbi:MAG: Ig-like domain-containing protein [Clostridia bacterium]|nr:Ig-like domain-containing protein [Clostridia bacterium]
MKRIIAILLSVITLFGVFVVASSAASYKATWTLNASAGGSSYGSADTIYVSPGEKVSVTLSFANNYYAGPLCAQIFYSSPFFTGAENLGFNKSGRLYATTGNTVTYADWDSIAASNREAGWPVYPADKLADYKANHRFLKINMIPNVMVTQTAAKSVDEVLLTMRFTVSSSAKNGQSGEIEIPVETMRTSSNKFGNLYCGIYTDGDMTKSPIQYSDSLTFDCTKAKLRFVVSDDAVSIDPQTVTMNYKSTLPLTATVNKGSVKTVNWTSSNTDVVTVDSNGNIKAAGKGTATVTATTTDGKYSGSCEVKVKYSLIQIIIIYVLFGFIWYK